MLIWWGRARNRPLGKEGRARAAILGLAPWYCAPAPFPSLAFPGSSHSPSPLCSSGSRSGLADMHSYPRRRPKSSAGQRPGALASPVCNEVCPG